MKKNLGYNYKVGDAVYLSEPEGGKEYEFTVFEITNDIVYIVNDDGNIGTLEKPPDTH